MKVDFHKIIVCILGVYLCGCTIDEGYKFNSDLSGNYTFKFDYSALLELDSNGSANAEMEKGYVEMEEELKKIDGISKISISSDNENGKVIVSYDFANLDALNQTNYNEESGQYSKYFSHDGKKFAFTADFSKELKEYTDPSMSLEELKENIQSMLVYTITFQFENKIKLINASNIEQRDDHSLTYTLNEQGLSSASEFELKLR